MNLFELNVGTITRKGTFVSAVRKIISTNMDHFQLHNKMVERYTPFEVRVSPVQELLETIEVPEVQINPKKPEEPQKLYTMAFHVQLTTEERTKRETLAKALDTAQSDMSSFEYAVQTRLSREIPFVSGIQKFKTERTTATGEYCFNYPLVLRFAEKE